MKAYTLEEVSKKINLAPKIIRQWEKNLHDLLDIPRSKQGDRIYSDAEIQRLLEIKQLYEKKFSKEKIRHWLQKKMEPEDQMVQENSSKLIEQKETQAYSMEVNGETETQAHSQKVFFKTDSLNGKTEPMTPQAAEHTPTQNAQAFFETIETYKKNFLNEVKEEIRNVVKKEVVEEVKKEISKGNLVTVRTISDSIYKSTAHTRSDIEELSKSLEKASEQTMDKLEDLANHIQYTVKETSDEIAGLSKQLKQSTEEISYYIDLTNNEISQLTECFVNEREILIEDREELRNEISQREEAFRQMLTNFREAAAAKNKSWWKFWANL